jgi:hypothetical protein
MRINPALGALAIIVFAESLLMAVATIYLVIEILSAASTSLASAIALAVLTAVAAAFLAHLAISVLRGRTWVRGAVLTWQLLQVAVAIGCFQGFFARPDIGWFLLVPALVAVGLLFTAPVMAATTRSRED